MSETDKRLRERLIAAGQLRPNTKELDPIQLCPGAIVFRINHDEVVNQAWSFPASKTLSRITCSH